MSLLRPETNGQGPSLKLEYQGAYLLASIVITLDWSEDTLTCFGIVDEWVTLGSMHELKVLCTRLPEDGFLGHDVVMVF